MASTKTQKKAAVEPVKTKAELHDCLCGKVRVDFDNDEQIAKAKARNSRIVKEYLDPSGYDEAGWRYLETFCTAQTASRFAPGHDARVKGLLQVAYAAGASVTRTSGGMAISSSAENVAHELFPGFADQVLHIPARLTKPKVTIHTPAHQGGTTKGASKPKAKVAGSESTVQAKVGRWTHEGYLEGDVFVYVHKTNGNPVRVPKGKYTLIAA